MPKFAKKRRLQPQKRVVKRKNSIQISYKLGKKKIKQGDWLILEAPKGTSRINRASFPVLCKVYAIEECQILRYGDFHDCAYPKSPCQKIYVKCEEIRLLDGQVFTYHDLCLIKWHFATDVERAIYKL